MVAKYPVSRRVLSTQLAG